MMLKLQVKATIAALLLVFGLCGQADSGSMTLLGVGGPAAGGAFAGPGDVIGGWMVFYGTRAFSSATRGNKLINVCNSTGGIDVGCADMLSDASTGNLVPQTIATISCPGNVNCTIKTFYDISGATNCTGPVACDITQSTIGQRFVLTASAIGTKTCGVASAANTYTLTTFVGRVQPFSVTGVAAFSSLAASGFYLGSNLGGGVGVGQVTAGTIGFYANNNITGTVANTSGHAFQSIANSASSFSVTDGTTGSTQASGGQAWGTQIVLGGDGFGNTMRGAMCETGLNSAAFTGGNVTSMHSNQSAYWGTP